MNASGTPTTRRGFVRGFLVGVGGLLGIGGARGALAAEGRLPTLGAATLPAPAVLTEVLHGRYFAIRRPGGAAASSTDNAVTLSAELTTSIDGTAVGTFHASGTLSTAMSWSKGLNTLLLSVATFELSDGSIFAVGSIKEDAGNFAIVGGTKAYQGIQGSVTAQIASAETGGENTATFTFSLISRQAFLPSVMRTNNGY